jgi:hypothetical protein
MATLTFHDLGSKTYAKRRAYVRKRLSDDGWIALEKEIRRRDGMNSVRASVWRAEQALDTASTLSIQLMGRVEGSFRYLEGMSHVHHTAFS